MIILVRLEDPRTDNTVQLTNPKNWVIEIQLNESGIDNYNSTIIAIRVGLISLVIAITIGLITGISTSHYNRITIGLDRSV